MTPGIKTQRPAPMPYHCAMVKLLQTTEPGLWSWFSSTRKRLEEADAVRLDLLKSTYRLERQAQPKLYDLATSVRERNRTHLQRYSLPGPNRKCPECGARILAR
jgi:hypothetical protein